MRLDYTNPESLLSIVEALVFATDEPLSAQDIRSLILDEQTIKAAAEPTPDIFSEPNPASGGELGSEQPKRKKANPLELSVLKDAIRMLNELYEESGRTFRIIEIAGGYQFATKPDVAMYVSRLYKDRSRRRLSGAALETLSIIAYKQPVSKSDIENIRGVNCDEVIKSLLEKNLITITGRAESVGRPLLYGTTQDFLRHFGLGSMRDLPKPREIEELLKEESVKATTLEEAANEFVDQNGTEEDSVTIDEVIAVAKEEQERDAQEEAEVIGLISTNGAQGE
ncbi:MAG: SMC-Scp complex subunit ScpB [Bacteroidota bacterium]|nr:SMC-Scp complex subunit ScpB [Bacteroidota bacterium]MDP4230345.1 SMC-Scp complex subunit ScpB [Bacteroidota bacterium]MDP4235244.1 SMC-Scp complex subunit ScpB [Bacteroidota bacterium]